LILFYVYLNPELIEIAFVLLAFEVCTHFITSKLKVLGQQKVAFGGLGPNNKKVHFVIRF